MASNLLGSLDQSPGGRGTAPCRAVAALQAELHRLQVLPPTETVTEGVFDSATGAALRRFQWFAGQVPGAVDATGAFVARPTVRLTVDGVVRRRTRELMATFREHGWAATGLLQSVDFAKLQRTRPGAGFTALLGGNPMLGLCERDFVAVLAALDATARRLDLFMFVHQLFRVEGAADDAVVAPSSFSPHKVGRAVDLQLGAGPVLEPGSAAHDPLRLHLAAPASPFARFRQHAKTRLKCRYGGDFDPVDAPHFDRQILPAGSPTWEMHYFFDQLHYRQLLRNPAAVPAATLG
jgi:hypothetical protein